MSGKRALGQREQGKVLGQEISGLSEDKEEVVRMCRGNNGRRCGQRGSGGQTTLGLWAL